MNICDNVLWTIFRPGGTFKNQEDLICPPDWCTVLWYLSKVGEYVPTGLKNVKLFSSNEAKFGNAEPAEPRGLGD